MGSKSSQLPKFPASWNCDQLGGILTFSRNQGRSVWKSTPEDSRRHTCNFGHPSYIGPWLCLLSNNEGKCNIHVTNASSILLLYVLQPSTVNEQGISK